MRHRFNAVLLLVILPVATHALEVRVAPSDYVFLNENNRLKGIYDVMLQNIAIVNDSKEEITIQRMEITGLEQDQPILIDIIHFQRYEKRWSSLKPGFSIGPLMSSLVVFIVCSYRLRSIVAPYGRCG